MKNVKQKIKLWWKQHIKRENKMSRRSKENKKYWNKRVDDLFELAPEMSMVEKKYDSLKLLLQQKYPFIKEQEDHIQFLKDVVYLDRLIRLKTEGQQVEEKRLLEQEYIIENLQ